MANPFGPNETDLAWAAGFFDGEGSIGVYRERQMGPHRLTLTVVNTHHRSIEKFAQIVGQGHISVVEPSGNRQRKWTWRTQSRGAREVLRLLTPFLVTKRNEAEAAGELKTLYPGKRISNDEMGRRDAIASRLKEMKYGDRTSAASV